VIAQELQEVTPYMVSAYQRDGTEYLQVDSAMTYMLVNAVQEQQETIETQQEQITQLLQRIEAMETGVQNR